MYVGINNLTRISLILTVVRVLCFNFRTKLVIKSGNKGKRRTNLYGWRHRGESRNQVKQFSDLQLRQRLYRPFVFGFALFVARIFVRVLGILCFQPPQRRTNSKQTNKPIHETSYRIERHANVSMLTLETECQNIPCVLGLKLASKTEQTAHAKSDFN